MFLCWITIADSLLHNTINQSATSVLQKELEYCILISSFSIKEKHVFDKDLCSTPGGGVVVFFYCIR